MDADPGKMTGTKLLVSTLVMYYKDLTSLPVICWPFVNALADCQHFVYDLEAGELLVSACSCSMLRFINYNPLGCLINLSEWLRYNISGFNGLIIGWEYQGQEGGMRKTVRWRPQMQQPRYMFSLDGPSLDYPCNEAVIEIPNVLSLIQETARRWHRQEPRLEFRLPVEKNENLASPYEIHQLIDKLMISPETLPTLPLLRGYLE